MASIQWLEWNDESFDTARRANKPVLLSIVATWCRWCKAMDHDTFSDTDVVEFVEKEFIPIRVDSDRRPDINDRYNMGGWPTTAFLTEEGDLITGGTYFDAINLEAVLKRIAQAYKENRGRIEEAIREMAQKEEEAAILKKAMVYLARESRSGTP